MRPILRGNTPDVIVDDQGLLDSSPALGALTYVSAIPSSGCTSNVTTGFSKPILPAGGGNGEEIDLNSIKVYAQSAGDSGYEVFRPGFHHLGAGLFIMVGGTLNAPVGSTVTFELLETRAPVLRGHDIMVVDAFLPGALLRSCWL